MAFTDNRNNGAYFDLIGEKEKVSVQEIITDFPDGVHITGCTVMKNKKKDEISAWTFAEDNSKFFFGGVVLTELAKSWIQENGGTAEACSEALKKEQPLMKLYVMVSANGNNYTNYEIVEQ